MEEHIIFENNAISSQSLPKIETLAVEAISKKYRLANFGINIFLMLFTLLMTLFFHYQKMIHMAHGSQKVVMVVCIALIVLFFYMMIFQLFADKQKFYALRDQDLTYMSGLIFKKIVTQPILRIQHIELKRGPIDRKLGLAKVQLFSAGGAWHTFEIPGLDIATAESIRQFILEHKDIVNHG